MCGADALQVAFAYAEPPPLETRFPLPPGRDYWREMHRCARCGHYLEWFELAQDDFYSGQYVTSTYGDPEGLRRSFERVNALPEERSDNAGRVRHVDGFVRAHHAGPWISGERPRLLDVGAGLGVFPWRMRQAGWDCHCLDLDPRLVAHCRDVAGVPASLGDVRDAGDLGHFDLISFNKVLEHVTEPVAVLAAAARLLAPMGLVYVELPDGEAAASEGKEREEFLVGHVHAFSFASFALLVQRAGLQLMVCERLREPSGKYTLRGFARISAAPGSTTWPPRG